MKCAFSDMVGAHLCSRAAISLIAATNQTPSAPSSEQTCSGVAPKIALTPLQRSFRGETSLWLTAWCSSSCQKLSAGACSGCAAGGVNAGLEITGGIVV
jgi:hypothetical protein